MGALRVSAARVSYRRHLCVMCHTPRLGCSWGMHHAACSLCSQLDTLLVTVTSMTLEGAVVVVVVATGGVRLAARGMVAMVMMVVVMRHKEMTTSQTRVWVHSQLLSRAVAVVQGVQGGRFG